MYSEHTEVRYVMKDSKEVCNTYVYNLLFISSGFRGTELSMGRLYKDHPSSAFLVFTYTSYLA